MRLRSGNLLWSFSLISLVLFAKLISVLLAPDLETQKPRAPTRLQVASGTLPFYFERNQGQSPPQVKFLARAAEAQLFLTSREVIFELPATGPKESVSFSMRFKDAHQRPYVTADEPLSGRTNYLVGNDPTHWNTKISHYGRVRYRELYPGIDLVFYENQGQLEYDFLIAPGADPNQIQLEFMGIDDMLLDRDGRLVLQAGDHTIIQHIPAVYQELQGRRQTVEARHQVDAAGRVRFALAEYDRSHTLFLDPVLEFSRFFGGSGVEEILSVATDEDGNIYMTGGSSSPDLPVTPDGLSYPSNVFETEGNRLAFVAKLDPTGTQLLYLTYLGIDAHKLQLEYDFLIAPGADPNQIQLEFMGIDDMLLDRDGRLVLQAGDHTIIQHIPAVYQELQGRRQTVEARHQVDAAGRVRFALAEYDRSHTLYLDPVLEFSRFFGGSGEEEILSVATDEDGNIYITGGSSSPDLPVTPDGLSPKEPGSKSAPSKIPGPRG